MRKHLAWAGTLAASALMAAGATWGASAAISGTSHPAAHVAAAAPAKKKAPRCAAKHTLARRYVTTRRISLVRWSAGHATYAGDVIGLTYACGPGWQQLSFLNYLDAAHLRSPMNKGTVLWSLPPPQPPA